MLKRRVERISKGIQKIPYWFETVDPDPEFDIVNE
jgi:hypothetical protein